MNVVKRGYAIWTNTAWFLVIALVLFAACTVAAAAPPEHVESPPVFTTCEVSNAPGRVPRNSSAALRRLIELRVACQDVLVQSADTELQSLADELGEDVESVPIATASMVSLKAEIVLFQGVVQSTDANPQVLNESLTYVLLAVDTLDAALDGMGDDIADLELQNSLELQKSLQNLQQVLQMLSNALKQAHDTAKAIINNIRG